MDPAFHYDEVHSVSDLHLGGGKNFQVFDLGATFAKLVDLLRQRPKGRQVALVVNGDFVDFLAEDPPLAFDPQRAVRKLERIAGDPAFAPVFQALQRFAATADRHLIITLGNHDLELALPWVEERLLQLLSDGDAAARGRILLSFDGSGFLCGVANKRVLCVHGNEVDTWNICDYERLRRLGRDLTQGRDAETWTPNAGSKMVIDVMNGIKQRYRFVDLLKPETEAAVPVLLAIDPEQASKLRHVLPVVGRRFWDEGRRRFGFLSAEDDAEAMSASVADAQLRRIVESHFSLGSDGDDAEAMLDRVEERLATGEDAHQTLRRDRQEEYLGVTNAVWKALRGASKPEVLREAFEGLKKDQSFELGERDATFRDLDAQIGPEVDFLIAGHTHLERQIPREHGSGTYFNTGTWIRLMRLTDAILDDPQLFAQTYAALIDGSQAALDRFTYTVDGNTCSLVLRRPAMVSIWEDDGAVHAELRRVDLETGMPGPRPEGG